MRGVTPKLSLRFTVPEKFMNQEVTSFPLIPNYII